MITDPSKLAAYLKAQRWFAGKAVPIKEIALIDEAEIPGARLAHGPALLAVLEVRYELGAPERYLLAVERGPKGEVVGDASAQPQVAAALLNLARRGEKVPSGVGALVGERIPGGEKLLDSVNAERVRLISAEQSNTSLVFDERVIMKLIRKLEAGVAPEHEIGRFLMTRTKFRRMPELLGALHLEGQSSTTVAVVHRFIAGAQDGWQWLLSELRKPKLEDTVWQQLTALGKTIAELHLALGSVTDDPAFSPEPIGVEDLQSWSASVVGELSVTIATAADQFPHLLEQRDPMLERAKRLAHVPPGGQKIRVHGDLHLGQVLRAQDGWIVFDFEGEPARPLAQRRTKHTALKDVAGMLRSFGYAAATVAKEQKRDALAAHGLEHQARKAFLQGYLPTMKGSPILPSEDAHLRSLLDAMELEKVLYEVRYEVNNRPDWAEIPVAALVRPEGSWD